MNSTTTPSGYWGGYFLKELTMDPLGVGWANCFRTHNELTMDPLGVLVFAPSVIENRWSGSLLGDGWTLEMLVPLSDEEGDRLLGSLGPGPSLSPSWECGDDEAPDTGCIEEFLKVENLF